MYRLRLLRILLNYLLFERRKPPRDEFVLTFRATPFDVELTRLTAYVYVLLMALARWHVVLNSIRWRKALREGWGPLTYSEHIRYRRAYRIFEKITVRTKIVAWNEQMVYFEHRFVKGDEVMAWGYSCGAMHARRGYISPAESFHGNLGPSSPTLPPVVRSWRELDQLIKDQARVEDQGR